MKPTQSKVLLIALSIYVLTGQRFVNAQSYQWHKQFAGNLPGASQGSDVAIDASGNVYVVGHFQGTINFGSGNETPVGYQDFFYAKYNSTGALQWIKKIGAANVRVTPRGVSLFNSGGTVFLYVCGTFTSINGQLLTVNFDPNNTPAGNLAMNDTDGDAFVAKYNASNGGTFEWARRVDNTQSDYNSAGKMATDASGNAYFASTLTGSPLTGFLRKYSSTGTLNWTVNLTGQVHDVALRGSTIFVCGTGLGSSAKPIAWYDTNGNQVGSTGSGSYVFQSIVLDSSTGIYVSSSTGAIEKHTTSSSSAVWARYFTPGFSGFSMDISLGGNSQSEIIATGWFAGTINLNNGSGSAFTITSSGSGAHDNVFASRHNASTGQCLWVRNNPSTTSSGQSNPLAIAANEGAFNIVGFVANRTIDANFCGGTANIVANNAINGYTAQYAINNSVVGFTNAGIVCTSGGTFIVTNLGAGAAVTWSVSPSNLVVTSSGTGSSAFVQAQPDAKAPAVITFYLSGIDDCGIPLPATLQVSFWVGLPGGGISGPSTVYPQQNYFYNEGTSTWLDGGYGYQWAVYGGTSQGINYNQIICNWTGPGAMLVLDYANPCGGSHTEMEITVTIEGGCDPCQIMETYPNPSSTELNIAIIETSESDSKKIKPSNKISLVNNEQKIVYKATTQKNEIKIPTVDLPEGKYILKVENKQRSETRQILVRH